MIKAINSVVDIRLFLKELKREGLNFHPDENFNNYININTCVKTYSKKNANFRNLLVKRCFVICNIEQLDFYQVVNDEYEVENQR